MNRQNTPYWLIVAALFVGILSLELIPEGMFFDGLGYAAIARNLAAGIGSFWSPHYTDTLLATFRDHPPLALGLESLLFRALGASIYVERVYSGMMALITALLVVALWRRLSGAERRGEGWLPLFFWLAVPLVTWSYGNNMLENTMGMFTTAAVWAVVAGMDERGPRAWLWGAGVFVWLAVLSKGPVGLFPLATPLVYWLVFRRKTFSDMVVTSMIVFAGTAAAALICLAPSAAARENLWTYASIQFQSSRQFQTAASHASILGRLGRELLPGLGAAALLLFVARVRGAAIRRLTDYGRPALFCFGMGLTASLPLIITLKQSGFYLVPAFPLFALAVAFATAPMIASLLRPARPGTRAHQVLTIAGSALLLAALTIATLQVGRVRRDPEKLAAVREIVAHIGTRGRLGICPERWTDWQLHAYFARYGQVSLDTNWNNAAYVAGDSACVAHTHALADWRPVALRTTFLQLYRRDEPH